MTARLNARVGEVTERIVARSGSTRKPYLDRIEKAAAKGPARKRLGCANFAHGFAACGAGDKESLREGSGPNLAIATAVALSHDMFDAAVYLGICDKIVPGLIIGALSFGHLPAIFLPAGPMPSGLPNDEKAKIRQLYAEGKATRADLLAAEAAAYHAPGTCTFYGTANTNQMLMEIMGLHLPGASFINPNTPLRDALTKAGVKRALEMTALGNEYTPIGHVIDERAIVNGVVGLHATGGSTNLTIHLIAMAAAAGIGLAWEDFSDLAEVTPLLTRIYPNGKADVNHFHAAGGMGLLIRELLGAGLLHGDAETVWGKLGDYAVEPHLDAE